jgi:hypothetical protein
MRNPRNRNDLIGTADLQNLFGLIRLLFVWACIIFFGVFGATQLDGIDPSAMADDIRNSNPLLQFIGKPVLVAFAAVVNLNTFRYMLAPTLAIIFILIAGALFVKDVYALRTFADAWRYVVASMFALNYPFLVIDKGVKQIPPKETHLIDVIGGPGYVVIEPGNAAMFRTLRRPSRVSVTSTYFLAPFETIAQTIYLDDQQGDKDEIPAITRDGIQVVLKDVHFRYRIQQQVRGGVSARKTLHDPYPYSDDAMRNVAFNVTVNKNGLEEWNAAVERMVVGAISDFVMGKKIDDLTAPIGVAKNPRIELRDDVLFKSIQKALGNIGAELLWIDVGHLHIVDEVVDEKRTELWAAEWLGDAEVTRSYGEAKRLAYQELGRAEAQAELILSITDALKQSIQEPSSTYNIRKLLLVRTAQVLDAMSSQPKNGQNKGENKND